MLVGKVGAYLSGASFEFSSLWQDPGFNYKHYTTLEKSAKDKHSSLFASYSEIFCEYFPWRLEANVDFRFQWPSSDRASAFYKKQKNIIFWQMH